VRECAEDFNAWLGDVNQLFTEDSEKKVILELISSHINKLQQTIVQTLKEAELYFPDSDCTNQVKKVIDDSITKSVDVLENLPSYASIELNLSKERVDDLIEAIDEIIDEIMWDCAPDDVSRKAIQASLPRLLCTIQEIDDLDAMFGFVGFDSKEIFRAISRLSVRGYYCSSLQSGCSSDEAYDQSEPGEVFLFAQTDAIRAFTYGYHEDVLDQVSNFVVEKLSEHMDDEDKIVEIVGELMDTIRDYGVENFAIPLLATIGNLNLNDLANLADSLIGMQSMKSAASPRPATMGGLIEILLIDREHGFRWFRKLPSRTSPFPVVA